MRALPRSAIALSVVAFGAAVGASVTTLLWEGAFPPPTGGAVNDVLAEARGWSAVTLAVVVFGLGALVRRDRLRWRLAWLGVLAYLVYTYLEFAVSPPFTPLYLVYVVAFASSVVAGTIGLTSLDLAQVETQIGGRARRWPAAILLLAIAVGLLLAWGKDIMTRTLSGGFGYPVGAAAVGHVVQALDLGLVVPLTLATALLLLRRGKGGATLGAITLVFGAGMSAALAAMVASGAVIAGKSPLTAAPFAFVSIVALAIAIDFYRRA
jgi:hypothetical protein